MGNRLDLRNPSIFIGKQGNGIISFGSGQPDLQPPREAIDIDIREDLRYGLIQGEYALREALSKEYPGSTPDNFVITNGASEAIDLILRSWGEGKMLMPRPYYYSYPPIVELSGMEPVYTDLVDGRIDMDDFKKKVKDCKAVMINSPSNPTGRVEAIDTLKEIEKITAELGVYVISDEVYKDLIYERENYHIKGDHVITVNSFSKTFALCGARIGYLWCADQNIADSVIDLKTHTSMNTSLISQDMALAALKAPKEYIVKQQNIWRERRDFIYKGFCDLGFELWKPEGAFYILPKCRNAREFVTTLFCDYKVIAYLGEWFGAPDHIRFSYALDKKEIEEGLSRIKDAMQKVDCL
ncbi:MAG: pyridoxal phosphate-dependent aminotransferase [Candidatus Tantalella remota]|nr:pyridoxal phosphate-dependent aminotransferase [Candidatus Tantalella remota]